MFFFRRTFERKREYFVGFHGDLDLSLNLGVTFELGTSRELPFT